MKSRERFLSRTRGPSWTYDRVYDGLPVSPRRRWGQSWLTRLWLTLTYRLIWRPLRDLARDEVEIAMLEHEGHYHDEAWETEPS